MFVHYYHENKPLFGTQQKRLELFYEKFGQSRNNIIVHTCNILIFTVKIGL